MAMALSRSLVIECKTWTRAQAEKPLAENNTQRVADGATIDQSLLVAQELVHRVVALQRLQHLVVVHLHGRATDWALDVVLQPIVDALEVKRVHTGQATTKIEHIQLGNVHRIEQKQQQLRKVKYTYRSLQLLANRS